MPATQQWIGDSIISTIWESPLKSSDLSACFAEMKQSIADSDQIVHVLFDVTNAGTIPAQAPMLFIRSQLTNEPNLGSMAVIGTNPLAQILAQTAIKLTGQNIIFFATEKDAVDYLRTN